MVVCWIRVKNMEMPWLMNYMMMMMMLMWVVSVVLSCHKPMNIVSNHFGSLGDQSWDFWAKTMLKSQPFCWKLRPHAQAHAQACSQRARTQLSSFRTLKRPLARLSVLVLYSILCFVFLCLFHPFLFRIGFWRKHESCRWLS